MNNYLCVVVSNSKKDELIQRISLKNEELTFEAEYAFFASSAEDLNPSSKLSSITQYLIYQITPDNNISIQGQLVADTNILQNASIRLHTNQVIKREEQLEARLFVENSFKPMTDYLEKEIQSNIQSIQEQKTHTESSRDIIDTINNNISKNTSTDVDLGDMYAAFTNTSHVSETNKNILKFCQQFWENVGNEKKEPIKPKQIDKIIDILSNRSLFNEEDKLKKVAEIAKAANNTFTKFFSKPHPQNTEFFNIVSSYLSNQTKQQANMISKQLEQLQLQKNPALSAESSPVLKS